MPDQENKTPAEPKPATETKNTPPVAIDSATPKAPVTAPAATPEIEKERKQA